MQHAAEKKLQANAGRLAELSSRPVLESPTGFIQQRRLDLDNFTQRLLTSQEKILSGKRQEFVRLTAALEAMSPLKVLSRSFSVTTDASGRVLRDAFSVDTGDLVHIRMEHGALSCRVEQRMED